MGEQDLEFVGWRMDDFEYPYLFDIFLRPGRRLLFFFRALPVVPFIKDGLRHYLRAYQDCPDWRQTKNVGMIRESLLVLWLPQLLLR